MWSQTFYYVIIVRHAWRWCKIIVSIIHRKMQFWFGRVQGLLIGQNAEAGERVWRSPWPWCWNYLQWLGNSHFEESSRICAHTQLRDEERTIFAHPFPKADWGMWTEAKCLWPLLQHSVSVTPSLHWGVGINLRSQGRVPSTGHPNSTT